MTGVSAKTVAFRWSSKMNRKRVPSKLHFLVEKNCQVENLWCKSIIFDPLVECPHHLLPTKRKHSAHHAFLHIRYPDSSKDWTQMSSPPMYSAWFSQRKRSNVCVRFVFFPLNNRILLNCQLPNTPTPLKLPTHQHPNTTQTANSPTPQHHSNCQLPNSPTPLKPPTPQHNRQSRWPIHRCGG